MEKIVLLIIAFACIALFIWNIIRVFKGKDSCCGCENTTECGKDTGCS